MKRSHLLLISGLCLLISPAIAIIDTNENGLSDLWERQHNDDELFPETFDPEADPDQDGWTNAQEAAAGTDPADPNPPGGFLRPEILHSPAVMSEENGQPVIITPEAVTISWPTLVGKQYTLQLSPDLSENWLTIDEPFIGDGAILEFNFLTASASSNFYRVAVTDVDSDGDTLTNAEEYELDTNPNSIDTDGDGNADGVEVKDKTLPKVPDTDDDTLADGEDASPTEAEINWKKTAEAKYIWIAQVGEVDPENHKHQPLAVNKHGQILFRDTRSDIGLTQIADPKNLWDSATKSWITLPLRGSQEIDVVQNDNDWHYDINGTPAVLPANQHIFNFNAPAYEFIDINDQGTVCGVSVGVVNLYVDPLVPGMFWKPTGAGLTQYTAPCYFYPQYPFPSGPGGNSEVTRLSPGPTGGAIAHDGSINSYANLDGQNAWMTFDSAAFNTNTPASASMVAVRNLGGNLTGHQTFPGAIIDKDRALFHESVTPASGPVERTLWLKDGATQTDISFMAPQPLLLAEMSLAPNRRNDEQDRLWITTGSKVFLERRAGGNGVDRWQNLTDGQTSTGKPNVMAEGAIRLNSRGEAITSGDPGTETPPKLWRNGKYHDLNAQEITSKPSGVSIIRAIDLASNGIILVQATENGINKTGLLLPVEVIDKDKKGTCALRVGRMEDSLDEAGALTILDDEDHFFVRIGGGHILDNASVKLESTCNPDVSHSDPSYNDDPTSVEMDEEGADAITKSLLLVADDTDDDYAGNGVGADDVTNDRTHKIQLGGKLVVKSVTHDGGVHQLDMKVPSPIKKVLTARIVMFGIQPSDLLTFTNYRNIAKERYAQVGIRCDLSITSMPIPENMPAGFDPDKVRDDDGVWNGPSGPGGILIHEDIRDLYDAAKAAGKTDVITVLVVPDMLDNVAGRAFWPGHVAQPHAAYANTVILSLGRIIAFDGKFTLAHELGHVLTRDGHCGSQYLENLPQYKINHNLMRNGTSPGNSLTGSKRWYRAQDEKFQQQLLKNP